MPGSIATLMAFDYGTKRIGIAVGQTISQTAEPLSVVPQNHGQIDWLSIEKIIAEWRPDSLIVGFPATADGRRIAIHDAIDRFANGLRKRFKLPVEYCDEHLSSFEASQSLESSRHELDALAAQVILQTWLENNR
ncbi:MAG: Holliday junction resolvase RuvX [Gammaproteobacteria bacterium]